MFDDQPMNLEQLNDQFEQISNGMSNNKANVSVNDDDLAKRYLAFHL